VADHAFNVGEIGVGGDRLVQQLLILRQIPNEAGNQAGIVGRGVGAPTALRGSLRESCVDERVVVVR